MMKCCYVKCISATLLVIGGLNWGLVGVAEFNVVEALLGSWPLAVRIVYGLVGLAAIVYVVDRKFCPCNSQCAEGKTDSMPAKMEGKAGCCGGTGKCKDQK